MKRLGIPDSQIILMLADDVACNPRNPFAGTVYSNADRRTDLYGEQIEVDYKGEEVSVETFLRLLSGSSSTARLIVLREMELSVDLSLCCPTLCRSTTRFNSCFETAHDGFEIERFRLHDWTWW